MLPLGKGINVQLLSFEQNFPDSIPGSFYLKCFRPQVFFYLHLGMSYTYLALGDSYTIGEQVMLAESFPYQTVQLLRKPVTGMEGQKRTGLSFTAPEVIAKTGWTTDELDAAVKQTIFLKQYDVVSLLIGVNNQYRGKSLEEFRESFTGLLEKAIEFAGGNHKRVFVLSIPDWGVTPFAADRDTQKIAGEIEAFNEICRSVSFEFGCTYLDITTSQKADSNKPGFLAADGLHPSGLEYTKWAERLADAIQLNCFK
jgi:lysophospholipase L1-like esterase